MTYFYKINSIVAWEMITNIVCNICYAQVEQYVVVHILK